MLGEIGRDQITKALNPTVRSCRSCKGMLFSKGMKQCTPYNTHSVLLQKGCIGLISTSIKEQLGEWVLFSFSFLFSLCVFMCERDSNKEQRVVEPQTAGNRAYFQARIFWRSLIQGTCKAGCKEATRRLCHPLGDKEQC